MGVADIAAIDQMRGSGLRNGETRQHSRSRLRNRVEQHTESLVVIRQGQVGVAVAVEVSRH